MKVIVSQKGAREHFLTARALHQRGMLAGLVTDWYAFGQNGRHRSMCGWLGALVCRYCGRFGSAALAAQCEALPDDLVHAFPMRTLFWKWRLRHLAAQGRSYDGYLQMDGAFATAVARLYLPPHEIFFGYSYASLEAMEVARARGRITVLCQIDPGPVHFRIVAEEMARHPELAGPPQPFPDAYFERSRREWELADVIVVNSEWTREALIAEGADPAKLEILPLAYEAEAEEVGSGCAGRADRPRSADLVPPARDANDRAYSSRPQGESGRGEAATPYPTSDLRSLTSDLRPLRVLWLGQVTPGKGIHYLMEAAGLLVKEPVRFDVVGSIGILPAAVASAPENMIFHGAVSRDRVADWYQQSEVFVLPTLSDGFALTQLEALSHGLPVITTPKCGRVVEDGKTGFIIPPRGAIELAGAILRFARDRHLSASMAPACRAAVKAYSVAAYGDHLVAIIETCARRPLS
jgi:glycosyltransferase involved in cell wall biosynthesis